MRDAMKAILCDPQTSADLLIAVPREKLPQYLSRVENGAEIGEVLQREYSALVVD
jgi:selenophosphate synthase